MSARSRKDLVLAVHPSTHGFGYVLMEGPLSPVDWGLRGAKGKYKNVTCIERITALLETHHPHVLALEDWSAEGSRRSARIRRLCRSIELLARSRGVEVCRYPRSAIRQCFESFGAKTRYETAQAIAKHVSAFARLLPKKRKLWESEVAAMALFSAAALALAFYFHTSDARRNED